MDLLRHLPCVRAAGLARRGVAHVVKRAHQHQRHTSSILLGLWVPLLRPEDASTRVRERVLCVLTCAWTCVRAAQTFVSTRSRVSSATSEKKMMTTSHPAYACARMLSNESLPVQAMRVCLLEPSSCGAVTAAGARAHKPAVSCSTIFTVPASVVSFTV